MNDLLFTCLIIALLYYFFAYLPEQQKLNEPVSINKSVQTDPLSDEKEKALASSIDELLKNIRQFNHSLK